jgi:superfamily I DNA/RNA helicase
MLPVSQWPNDVQRWFAKWTQWKKAEGLLDYTDFISEAAARKVMPYQEVIYVDEAQDHTPLQFHLLREGWPARKIVLVGDDDQNLYEWSGADPTLFFTPALPENEWVLEQSYRLPQAVHAEATRWISQIPNRKVKLFRPKSEVGLVQESIYSLKGIDAREKFPDGMLEDFDSGATVMLLVTCRYMTSSLTSLLVDFGIPFHNPYRKDDREWNPLADYGPAVNAFLKISKGGTYLTGAELASLLGMLHNDCGRTGESKKYLHDRVRRKGNERTQYTLDILDELADETLQAIASGSIGWLQAHVGHKISHDWRFQWACQLALKHGEVPEPKVVVGTIHSVKGGEAQIVYLFPDRSYAAMRAGMESRDGLHASIRLFYVGMTRASEKLVLMAGSDQTALPWRRR